MMDDKAKNRQTLRQNLLEQLTRNELEGDEIRQIVASSVAIADFFDDYQVNEIFAAIETDELDWNAGYFDRQRKLAQHNFAEKRVSHLIDVREYLIRNGIAGFAKAPLARRTEEAKTMNMQGYTPGATLAKMVEHGTTSQARSALINELEDNRLDDAEIERAVVWAQARGADLFVDYEENTLAGKMNNDPEQWDENYYYQQTSNINVNFAKVRFEHLITVRNTLRQRGVKGFERIIIKPKAQPQPQQAQTTPHPRHDSSSAPAQPGFLRVALMAGGALAVLAALVISLL
ncbi:hypothetical protein [Leclercia adecarboxylata]|nr:hypothetical protein [Leclercia adecarboxylata]MDC6656131.1 hypothetical protein [Leclercia adecarboxylata]MDC6666786.1 hypothetical protein [Leclercia adecarboxylata]MDC6672255.1 hypothetical protein [Leclercia adecarboxylata]MDC6691934.1 hypothetical protein [Leclercia adecarboxylata]MDC6697602.1 hypothetical protein [Leclercia adecarboxylata]